MGENRDIPPHAIFQKYSIGVMEMIERGLITAALAVVIIGALGKIGEGIDSTFNKVNCAFSAETSCESTSTKRVE